MSKRVLLFILVAFLLNLLLFYFIQQLVSKEQSGIADQDKIRIVDFIRMQMPEPEPEPPPDEREPPDPPEEEQEEPPPDIPQPDTPKPPQQQLDVPAPDIDISMNIDGLPYLGDFMRSPPPQAAPARPDIVTDIEPTVRVQPQYPPRALRSGIEGSVTVEFTIAKDGTVKDPEIVEADPAYIFNDAVLRAVRRWKFEPETYQGEKIEQRARQIVRFRLQ